MTADRLLVFGNVSQPPYCNNFLPPLRAFQKAFRTTVVEPARFAGFAPTGGAKPTLVPDEAVIESTNPPPDIVVCLGGGLHFSERTLRSFPKETVLAGFALSDPYGLEASFAIAPQFDLFYTQDPQTLPDYALRCTSPSAPSPSATSSTTASGHRTGTRSPPRSPRAFASASTPTRVRRAGACRCSRRSTRPMRFALR